MDLKVQVRHGALCITGHPDVAHHVTRLHRRTITGDLREAIEVAVEVLIAVGTPHPQAVAAYGRVARSHHGARHHGDDGCLHCRHQVNAFVQATAAARLQPVVAERGGGGHGKYRLGTGCCQHGVAGAHRGSGASGARPTDPQLGPEVATYLFKPHALRLRQPLHAGRLAGCLTLPCARRDDRARQLVLRGCQFGASTAHGHCQTGVIGCRRPQGLSPGHEVAYRSARHDDLNQPGVGVAVQRADALRKPFARQHQGAAACRERTATLCGIVARLLHTVHREVVSRCGLPGQGVKVRALRLECRCPLFQTCDVARSPCRAGHHGGGAHGDEADEGDEGAAAEHVGFSFAPECPHPHNMRCEISPLLRPVPRSTAPVH